MKLRWILPLNQIFAKSAFRYSSAYVFGPISSSLIDYIFAVSGRKQTVADTSEMKSKPFPVIGFRGDKIGNKKSYHRKAGHWGSSHMEM
jgi:hypothetical protein